ncbi:MAG: GNAT family N-acetyltransferase [Betaproteobacteria bacterium]|nr:GNAT family N-acetyltransferase [Betaproteobacteria bacterium]
MTDIEIRPAGQEDAPLIARLAREIWWNAYPDIIPDGQIEFMLANRYDPARLCDDMIDPEKWIDMAFLAGQFIGFAACEISKGEYKLDKLYVHPDRQQQGVGGALIRHVLERARKLAYPAMILAVNRRNEKAIAAYTKLGFTVRETLVTDIGHGFVMDDYIMELRVGG